LWVDDRDRRVRGGEGVEYSEVTIASNSGSESCKGSLVGWDASISLSVGFSRMKKE